MTTTQIIAFAGVVWLAAVSPGPDFAIVVRHAVVSGSRSGMATALGIASGVLVWAVTAALGVAALLAASAMAFTVVKIAGAAYLCYLGVKALLAARRGGPSAETGSPGARRAGGWVAFRHGLLCNLLNPKAAMFMLALMPQVLGPSPALAHTLLLSLLAAAISGAWFTVVANLVAALRRVFARQRVRRALDAVTGAALIALGAKIAATQ